MAGIARAFTGPQSRFEEHLDQAGPATPTARTRRRAPTGACRRAPIGARLGQRSPVAPAGDCQAPEDRGPSRRRPGRAPSAGSDPDLVADRPRLTGVTDSGAR